MVDCELPPYTTVSALWLRDHLDDGDIQIVDASWTADAPISKHVSAFEEGRIPGSIFVNIGDIAAPEPGPPSRMMPTPEHFRAVAGRLGLRPDAHIVFYDTQGLYSAARAWLVLKSMGHARASVLDGGLKAWQAENLKLDTTSPQAPTPTQWPEAPIQALTKTWQEVLGNITTKDAQLIDVRPPAMFDGDTGNLYANVRSGHIPGAVNLSQRALRDDIGRYKSDADILALMSDAGIDVDKPMIASCGSGVTACILSLALARMGRDITPIYDGSWEEWGSRKDLPIELNGTVLQPE